MQGVDGLGDGVVPLAASLVIDPATNAVVSRFDMADWSDLIVLDGRLWFIAAVRDGSTGLSLLELNPSSGQPAQRLTFAGDGYSNTTFESGGLASAGGYLWILSDPTPDAPDGPQIVRIPRAELHAP